MSHAGEQASGCPRLEPLAEWFPAWLMVWCSIKSLVNMHRRIFALNVTSKTQTVFAGTVNVEGNVDGPALSAQITTKVYSALAVNSMTGDVSVAPRSSLEPYAHANDTSSNKQCAYERG